MSVYGVSVRIMLVALMLATSACSAGDADSPGGIEIRVSLSEDAMATEVGLPAYPNAKPYVEDGDSDASANVRLATPLFGLKVIASEFETPDAPRAVAAFYRKALAKYGTVLECTDSVEVSARANDDGLTCEDGDHEKGTYVYKAGTKSNHRIVAIEPHGGGAKFALVHLTIREGN